MYWPLWVPGFRQKREGWVLPGGQYPSLSSLFLHKGQSQVPMWFYRGAGYELAFTVIASINPAL